MGLPWGISSEVLWHTRFAFFVVLPGSAFLHLRGFYLHPGNRETVGMGK